MPGCRVSALSTPVGIQGRGFVEFGQSLTDYEMDSRFRTQALVRHLQVVERPPR